MVRILAIDNSERIEFHSVLFENAETAHDRGKGWLATLVHAIGIVNFLRSIDRESNQKLVTRQEVAPCIVEQCAVRLKGVVNLLAVCISGLQLNDTLKEWNPEQRRLA